MFATIQTLAKPARDVPYRIVIDAGHGGENMGALGVYGIYEKAITLSIAKKLEEIFLGDSDYKVFMTRSNDTYISLQDRAEIANELEADVFVSIHCNASTEKEPSGFETYFFSPEASSPEDMKLVEFENSDIISKIETEELDRILNDLESMGNQILSEKLAEAVQSSLAQSLNSAIDRGVKQAPFALLKASRVPAIVVEVGFITHKEEGLLLLMSEYQQKIAAAIYTGIKKYIKSRNAYSPPLR